MFVSNFETPVNPESVLEKNEIQGREVSEADEMREQEAAELMGEVFTPEVVGNWENYTPEQKEQLLDEYSEKLAESLGVDALDVIIEPMEPGLCGYTNGNDGTIHISEELVNNPEMFKELLDTVAHETRHCFQHEVARHPENYPDISQEIVDEWSDNIVNYITPETDPQGYWEQPIEVDARDFAEDVVDRYQDMLDV